MNELLRSLWAEPRPPHPPRRVWRDWALVAVLLPAAVLEGVFRPDLPSRLISTILVAGLVPTLLWRRTRPLLMLALAFGTSAVAMLVIHGQAQNYTLVYLLILPYALVRWGSGREVTVGLAIVLANVGLSAALGSLSSADAFGGAAILFATIALGAAFRYRSRARRRELDQAKLLERERVARDLHDTVAHHVSAMAIRAQAGLATMATRPDAAAEALRLIESEASHALEEMRAMVRVLRRNEPAELTPSPSVARSRAAREHSRRSGRRGRDRRGPRRPAAVGRGRDLPPRPGIGHQRPAPRPPRHPRRSPRRRRRQSGAPARER